MSRTVRRCSRFGPGGLEAATSGTRQRPRVAHSSAPLRTGEVATLAWNFDSNDQVVPAESDGVAGCRGWQQHAWSMGCWHASTMSGQGVPVRTAATANSEGAVMAMTTAHARRPR